MDEEARERIERQAEEMDPTPSPGWEKMEEVAREARQQAGDDVQPGEDIPLEEVPPEERLDRPVGTESDSY